MVAAALAFLFIVALGGALCGVVELVQGIVGRLVSVSAAVAGEDEVILDD